MIVVVTESSIKCKCLITAYLTTVIWDRIYCVFLDMPHTFLRKVTAKN